MRTPYPVVAEPFDGSTSQPPEGHSIGIFDAYGYWLSTPKGTLQFRIEDLDQAKEVADAINAAFEAGQRRARAAMREALGIGEDDE